MKKKTMVGLIAIAAIATAVMFAGCVEEKTPVSTPTPTATPHPETALSPAPATTHLSTILPTPT
jgi:hypothetical protein